jgi:hypothetical protein
LLGAGYEFYIYYYAIVMERLIDLSRKYWNVKPANEAW